MDTNLPIKFTEHASQRRQQRGIDPRAVDLLLAYGAQRRSRGASLYFLTSEARRRLASDFGEHLANQLLPKMDLLVVESDQGEVITVARRTRRVRNDVSRRSNRLH